MLTNRSASLCNMQCMLLTAPNVLIMGGHQPLLVTFDLETRQEIQQVVKCCRFSQTFIFTSFVHRFRLHSHWHEYQLNSYEWSVPRQSLVQAQSLVI